MQLKPQDMLVLLKLLTLNQQDWSYAQLAQGLRMSQSEVHAAVKRVLQAGLAVQLDNRIRPHIRNLQEFMLHGLRYVFVPEQGSLTRGMPTSYAAEPLTTLILSDGEPVPVWPDAEGTVRGVSFSPLYKSAPEAAKMDKALYEWLALVDALRGGRSREKVLAADEVTRRLAVYGKSDESEY